MSTIDRLIADADAYLAQSTSKPTTERLLAFRQTTKLSGLRSVREIQPRFANAGFRWFAVNWPERRWPPAIFLARRGADFLQGLQRPSAAREDLSGGPCGGGI